MATPSAIPKVGVPSDPSKEPSTAPSSTHSPKLPAPKFRLEIHDLRHPAALFFLTSVSDLTSTLETALIAIIRNLYIPSTHDKATAAAPKRKHPPTFTPSLPPTRSVTVLLRDIGGVAYTTGKDIDNDNKEIHISLGYIEHCATKADPLAEIVGVLTHELVHCYQYAAPRATIDGRPDNCTPRAPGGLIEGIADFVRLKAGLSPPHWSRPTCAKERPEKWDSGYQHTAYFLAWLEDVRVGRGAVGLLNDRLCRVGYVGDGKSKEAQEEGSHKKGKGFWTALYGSEIDQLWDEYGNWLDNPNGQGNWEDELINPSNDGPSSITAPYVKAVTRDLRNYMSARNHRQVPVGYSAADVDTNRREMAEYMNCGTKEERSDFFAFNDYSWCSPSSFEKSGWDAKVKNFTGYGLPLFLSEYGCNTNKRDFGEVEALYSKKMTGVYSGGLVYEYSQEPSNYGLVKVKGGDVSDLKDFDALKTAFEKTDNPEGDGGYNKTGGANPCPARNAPNWDVDSEDVLPAMPEPAKKYFENGAGKGDGFSGSGSQSSGTPSSSNTTDGEGNTVDGSVNTENSGSSDDEEGAAAGLAISPVFVGMVTVFSTLAGAGMALF